MPDLFGKLALPAAAPVTASEIATPGDPGLRILASYLAAVLNAQVGQLWTAQGVCPGRKVVERYYTHDPRVLFNESKLPALYLWCGNSKPGDACAAYREDVRTINILWVLEGGQEEHQIKRVTVFNAVAKLIERATKVGRDPSWVVTGDTDPAAATYGSLYTRNAGFFRVLPGPYQPQNVEVYITDGEGKPMPFPALALSLEVTEWLERDPSLGTYPSHVDVNFSNQFSEATGTIEDLPT